MCSNIYHEHLNNLCTRRILIVVNLVSSHDLQMTVWYCVLSMTVVCAVALYIVSHISTKNADTKDTSGSKEAYGSFQKALWFTFGALVAQGKLRKYSISNI